MEDIDITERVRNSPVLARIVEEVRQEEAAGSSPQLYNRMHNRHNRSGPRWPLPPPPPQEEYRCLGSS